MKVLQSKQGPVWVGQSELILQTVLRENRGAKHAIVTDEQVRKHCFPLIEPLAAMWELPVWTVPSGEQSKQLGTCQSLWYKMAELNFDRDSKLIALGGGMITDLVGFTAACYMRGIGHISVPTSLLAQVDAALGGKTGVDLGPLKNYIGAFKDAEHVILDHRYLDSLPERQYRNGLAEVVKHALIEGGEEWAYWSSDRAFAGQIGEAQLIQSARIKLRIVDSDPEEAGLRRILNLGHTVGHAIEAAAIEIGADMLHGEAVVAGLWCECRMAAEAGLMPAEVFDEIAATLAQLFTKPDIESLDPQRVMYFMQRDKKNSGGRIRVNMLKRPGDYDTDVFVAAESAMQSLVAYMR